MERLFTIGVYGFEADRFFTSLQEAEIDLFLDLRRRRGVRGAQYAFANAGRLQAELDARGVAYRHVLDLAPQQETRALQSRDDAANRIARRKRTVLGETFVADYTERTLETFDWDALVRDLEAVKRPVLFCVEGAPEACHRGLVAVRLSALAGVPVTDLLP